MRIHHQTQGVEIGDHACQGIDILRVARRIGREGGPNRLAAANDLGDAALSR